MTKQELRKLFNKKRTVIDPSALPGLQQQIFHYFKTITLPSFSMVMSYAAMLDRNEFDIHIIERYLQDIQPATRFCWPKIREGYEMDAMASFNNDQILNQYGIREPANGVLVNPFEIDIVMIPLLAFDQLGYRVGYGKGYYDRFLSKCRKDVMKIGFSFFEAEPVIKDINNYDVPLNYCITPLRVYEF